MALCCFFYGCLNDFVTVSMVSQFFFCNSFTVLLLSFIEQIMV